MGDNATAWLTAFVVLIAFSFVVLLIRRYKRCPSNKILVVYGKVRDRGAAKCVHGGGTFVWPLIQDFAYLDLEPLQIEIPLRGALSLENIRVNVPSVFTVAIGTEPATMQQAAIRLLGLRADDIEAQARDIIFGQLRQVIASMRIEEINRDRDSFLESILNSLEPELRKIGLVLINVNITDITDESGYIEAIGRKAAATAIQQAEIDVAEEEKKGAVGVARANKEEKVNVAVAEKERDIGTKDADRERVVRVAELDKDARVGQANANSLAVKGENEAKAVIAKADADLQVEQAIAYQLGETRRRVAEAEVLRVQYEAQEKAAVSEAAKVEAEQTAALVAPARAKKAQIMVDAEATAERIRIEAEGEAKAIFVKLEAEARGQYEILAKKGLGFAEIVKACGGPQSAFQMLMLEHLDNLSANASQAIQGIKFDKIVVWDGGGKNGGPGATSNFLSGLAGALPPMLNMMSDIGGVKMPDFFGKLVAEAAKAGGDGPSGDGGDGGDSDGGDDTPKPKRAKGRRKSRGAKITAASEPASTPERTPAPEPEPKPDTVADVVTPTAIPEPAPAALPTPAPESTPAPAPAPEPATQPPPEATEAPGAMPEIEVIGGEEWPPITDLGPDTPEKP